ncbi:hybrid sensor histidine kinase/response regulator [Pseudoalteromonas sp. G4]|uniref:hybrid sensor histidine kinase/response regulator n=1 Tax=Pseudoalteromonas sp. G4 TaxID=2992761 RepID=UPI00237E954F|nr:hybrid sensor histidine kinase/response regulator [Pseudoalteromonas sp. G4]MDE3272893.1 ATP-binding protein [Pseudoalteromonas sp. G4]
MNNNKLSVRLLWYITPLVIIPMAIQGIFSLTNVTSSSEKQAEAIVTRFVEQQVNKSQNFTQFYNSIIELLSASPVLNNYLIYSYDENDKPSKERTKLVSSLVDEFGNYVDSFPHILSIGVINPQGDVLSYYPKAVLETRDSYPFSNQLTNNRKQQNIFFISENDKTSIYLTYRLFDSRFTLDSPKVLGYLIFHIDSDEIARSVANDYFSDTVNFIMDNTGKILFCNKTDLNNNYVSEYELQLLKKTANTEEFNQLSLHTLADDTRMILANSMSNDLYFVTALNKNSLYKAGQTITMYTALLILSTAIFLPGIIFLVVRRMLLKPIESLAEASHKVGDGNLNVKLPQDRKDELGMLFRDFNHMVNQIKQYQTELLDYREHLEEKVVTRTQAIAKINKKLEKAIVEAEQANHLKSRFLANMSHEIRTPLTAIMGFTETILGQESNNKKAKYLSTVLRNSKHLLELINNILDLSKIEADKLEVETRVVELMPFINDIKSIIEPMALDKELALSLNIDYPLPSIIHSDETRLKQVLLNICTNAVKFTEKGEVAINVRYSPSTEKLIFTVTDSGIGMSQQEQERAFKPFEQADISTTRKFGGTGLGLCIAKNLAQILGGDITVTSKLSEGSKFEIIVATNNQNHKVAMVSSANSAKAMLKEESIAHAQQFEGNILVAEDNKDNQDLIRLLLSQWGISPDFANNGAEAVEQALTNDYDLILMDMQMPVMGGLEATQMLRNAAYDGPIVALTANVMKNDVDAYLEAGCDKALAKPIDKVQLEQTLQQYLSLERDSQQNWEELFQGERFKQISDNYKSKLPNLLKQIAQLNEQQDLNELLALSHSIKGSAGCFGFNHISDAAAELESCIREHNEEGLDYHILKLEQAIIFILNLNEDD